MGNLSYFMGMKPKERRILYSKKLGRFAIEIPEDMARMFEPYNGEVALRKLGNNKIVIAPPDSAVEKLIDELHYKEEDPIRLVTAIFARYMNGYDAINITIPINAKESKKVLKELVKELYGATIKARSATHYTLTFSDEPEMQLSTVISTVKKLNQDLRLSNLNAYESFPNKGELQTIHDTIEVMEDELDKLSFYVKRQINRSLMDPEVYERIGMQDRRDAVHYSTVLANSERIGDLQNEISSMLLYIASQRKAHIKIVDISALKNYYNYCSSFVDEAFKAFEDLEAARRLVDSETKTDKNTGLEYRHPILPLERRKNVIHNILNQKTKFIQHLLLLEGKAWALIGSSTNIAEAFWDMKIVSESTEAPSSRR